jgi:tetratricopeptide (TPR) repeat protein
MLAKLPASPAAAAYLLGWAEIFRIRVAHGRGKAEAAKLAPRLYRRAAELDPLAGSVHYYWSLLDTRRARKLLEQALAAGPDHLPTLGALGAAARKARDYDRAIELLERYVRVFRGHHSGGVWGIYWDFHLAELSIAHYEKACVALYGVPPGEPRPPGKPTPEALDRAEAAIAPALALYETLSWSQRKAGAGVFQLMAIVEEFRGNHARALEWADRAVEANPDNAYLLSTRGGCLNNLGRLDEALACSEQALALDKSQWHSHLVIACVLAKRDGDRKEILRRLRRVIALWPEGRAELASEPDLAVLRGEPAFEKLVAPPRTRKPPRR